VRGVGFFIVCCLLAAVVPWIAPKIPSTGPDPGQFPGGDSQPLFRGLKETPLSASETRFFDGFPGWVRKFVDGDKVIIGRWVTRPTRMLHPAAHCFRAEGYTIKPLPLRVDPDGKKWGRMECRKGEVALEVAECVWSDFGDHWSDVSSWYWAATLGRSEGPWWSALDIRTTAR
jgi:hypothetical protein